MFLAPIRFLLRTLDTAARPGFEECVGGPLSVEVRSTRRKKNILFYLIEMLLVSRIGL